VCVCVCLCVFLTCEHFVNLSSVVIDGMSWVFVYKGVQVLELMWCC